MVNYTKLAEKKPPDLCSPLITLILIRLEFIKFGSMIPVLTNILGAVMFLAFNYSKSLEVGFSGMS